MHHFLEEGGGGREKASGFCDAMMRYDAKEKKQDTDTDIPSQPLNPDVPDNGRVPPNAAPSRARSETERPLSLFFSLSHCTKR